MDESNCYPVFPGDIAGNGSDAQCLLLSNSSELNGEIPLHLLVNGTNASGIQYIITVPQSQLQHCVDSQEDTRAFIENLHAGSESSKIIKQKDTTTSYTKTVVNNKIIPKIAAVSKLPLEATAVNPSKRKVLKKASLEDIKKSGEKKFNYVHISDAQAPPRAVAVLPAALRYRRGAVTARSSLPPRVRFGPVSGPSQRIYTAEADELISEATVSSRPIFLIKRENESVYHIDMSDKDRCNWFSLLPLGDHSTANVWLYEDENVLYGITTRVIPPRTPLALGYSKIYAETHKMSPEAPVLDLQEALLGEPTNNQRLSSFKFLQRHAGVDFMDEKNLRRKYRCSQCRRTFSRLFTLKRHMSRFCTRKAEQDTTNFIISSPQEDKQTNPMQCSTPLMEDSRMPSDESLQNYTNGLDFSTNLFDTDRMPNLDMSNSSKSEAEFNMCHIENSNRNSLNKTDKKPEEKIFVLCAYCDQTVVKEKYRHHYRECPSQRLECKCGKVFHKKENLSKHIHELHFDDIKPKILEPEILIKENVEKPYKCDECKLKFKRRGMLVNHAWRVHKRRAALPVERRVRHYPCAGCTNLYRTAAKRDAHAKKHHPGMEMHRMEAIEGARRRCEAAACPACPRQYVTRAKLLQHMRAHHPHHPHLEAPSKSVTNTSSKRKK